MNILFVNDSSCNPNWGDRAAALTLRNMILQTDCAIASVVTENDLKYSNYKNLRTDGRIQEPHYKKRLNIIIPPIIMKIIERMKKYRRHTGNQIIPDKAGDFDRYAENAILNKDSYYTIVEGIQKCDLVIIHGNGAMRLNKVIPRSMLFIAYISKKYFNKPTILINHTADLSHPELFKIAEKVYPILDDVVFRDVISLEKYSGLWRSRYAPDTAFILEPLEKKVWLKVVNRHNYFDVWPDEANFNPSKSYICIGYSSIYGGTTIRNYNADHGYVNLISHILKVYDGQIVLVVSDKTDEKHMRLLSKHFNLPLISLNTPVQQAVDIVGNADAYIGGRWHPSIFAFRGGTPVVPISAHTFKIEALIKASPLPSIVYDGLNLEAEKYGIGDQLIEYIQQGDNLRTKIKSWANEEAKRSWENISYLNTCKI